MAEEKKTNKFIIRLPKYLEYKPGYIYIIKIGDYIKIGRSWSPRNRLQSYSSFPPFHYDIILIESVPDSNFFERALQSAFIEFQVKGEWFDMPKYKMDYEQEIKNIFNNVLAQVKDKNIFGEYWNEIGEDYARWRKTHNND